MKNNSHEQLRYRPEIDGLRAIAVVAVLLFHAKLGMSGGFVGVDVFFVISGFLITSLILKDHESEHGFSILGFWERRTRRILPALAFVILGTVLAGWFILLPSDFLDLGKSVVAQAAFAGNFYFWHTSGYFEADAFIRPLLHTWSLAVEEQFYLLLPLLFLSRRRWSRKTLRWLFSGLLIASLVLSIIQVKQSPDTGFYLLPSRAWELLVGALLAVFPISRNAPRWFCELVGWAGLLAIGAVCLFYHESTPFPGMAAIPPVLGTAAIIWSTGMPVGASVLKKLLALTPVVFVGKMSYSLYLWHWPIIVYALYWLDNHILAWPYRVALLGLSFLLAFISWKFVETPFRVRKCFASRIGILSFGSATLVMCAVVGGFVWANKGHAERYPASVSEADMPSGGYDYDWIGLNKGWSADISWASKGEFPTVGSSSALNEGNVHCLLWGDSHAMALRPAFAELAKQCSTKVQFATHPATCPVLGYESFHPDSLQKDSQAWSQAIIAHVRKNRIPHVVIVANWPFYYDHKHAKSHKDFALMLGESTRSLIEAGSKVWILRRVPVQDRHIRISLAKSLLHSQPTDIGISRSKYLVDAAEQDAIFAPSIEQGAEILDPSVVFYAKGENFPLMVNGKALYSDNNHLSVNGAFFLMPLFNPVFNQE